MEESEEASKLEFRGQDELLTTRGKLLFVVLEELASCMSKISEMPPKCSAKTIWGWSERTAGGQDVRGS